MAGHSSGLMLHDMKGDGESEHLQTLSRCVQFPVLHALSIGMLWGSAISRCMLTIRLSSGFSSWSGLVR